MSVNQWNVQNGDSFVLRHVKTGLFLGVPTDPTVIPLVSDMKQYQILQIIAGTSQFSLVLPWQNQNFYLQPSNHLLSLTENKTGAWSFGWAPTSSNHVLDNPLSEPLHYGMSIYLLTSNNQSLQADDKNNNAVIVLGDSGVPPQEWTLFPTKAIHVCLNPQVKHCHFLEGVHVTQSMMHCQHTAEGTVQCFDDEGHPVFSAESDCAEACRFPTYRCSGAPLYQCNLIPIQDQPQAEVWQDFDTCTLNCLNPILALKPVSTPSDAPSLPVNKKQWQVAVELVILLLVVILGIIWSVQKRVRR